MFQHIFGNYLKKKKKTVTGILYYNTCLTLTLYVDIDLKRLAIYYLYYHANRRMSFKKLTKSKFKTQSSRKSFI